MVHYIPVNLDVFEVVVIDGSIQRVVKILGDAQLRIPTDYNELSHKVRGAITEYLSDECDQPRPIGCSN